MMCGVVIVVQVLLPGWRLPNVRMSVKAALFGRAEHDGDKRMVYINIIRHNQVAACQISVPRFCRNKTRDILEWERCGRRSYAAPACLYGDRRMRGALKILWILF